MARALPRPNARLAGALALAVLAAAGCQSGTGPLARWRMVRDGSLAPGPTKDELGDDRSMMARWLSPAKPNSEASSKTDNAMVGNSNGWAPMKPKPNPEADAEFQAALRLYQQGQLAEAEPAFRAIAKKRKETPWGEKAQYYLAETRYQRGNYVGAHDAYEELFKTYPGTRHLEKAVAREWAIANDWLAAAQAEPEAKDKDKDKDKEKDKADPKAKAKADAKPDPAATLPWNARLTGRLPLVDVNGHAESVLEHVRHHDPTGPLADDAVMRIADLYYSRANYREASEYYDQLIQQHPKSPFLQRAQLASIDSKIKDYDGPDYDGAGLEQARELVKQSLTTFPDRQASTADYLYHTLDLINDEQARRCYEEGEFYRRTKKATSAEYCFAEIVTRWPKSTWAKKAKEQLAQVAKMPRSQTLPSKIMTTPGSPDPSANGFGSNTSGMGAMGIGGMGGPTLPN
jgi:outer membrane protein assembly factor BamD (BamD/ComL family)